MVNNRKKELAQVVPTPRQLAWQEIEFYSFFHFGMNTFTEMEWGDGTADPKLFNPTALDATQWVQSVKAAGMKGCLLTCKHHDGFCLWPSKYTDYTLKASPYKDGKGDIVKEVAEACEKEGLKFGIYLSPWDRHEKTYGTKEYNDYFVHQLMELLQNYGPIFSVWFDGACGEGPNGKKQVYDWQRYYETIRTLQPDAVIAVSGPDVRWIGNEGGHTRKEEWSVVPEELFNESKIQEDSQKTDDETFRNKLIPKDEDLGSFDVVKDKKVHWRPAEVDVSIRPGWFYHPEEDDKVRSLENLTDIYFRAVGGNAALLLNIPPDKKGLIPEQDVLRLKELGEVIKNYQKENVAEKAALTSSFKGDTKELHHLLTDDKSYFKPQEEIEAGEFILTFEKPVTFNIIKIKEAIAFSQRVEDFSVEILKNDKFEPLFSGKTIGYQRIIRLEKPVTTTRVRLKVSARWYPILQQIALYQYDWK